PCASSNQPWRTANTQYTENGLGCEWPHLSRVWLNPPYGLQAAKWLKRLAEHGNGIALIFARTETAMFHDHVWSHADGLLFIRGRLTFYNSAGIRAQKNAGGPSVLVAYGSVNVKALRVSQIAGHIVTDGVAT
ncbi:hypothetical protein LCGC14_1838870, partial [marine sediment metagenome]